MLLGSILKPRKGALLSEEEVERRGLRRLTRCQRAAIRTVQEKAKAAHTRALPKLQERVNRLGFSARELDETLQWIRKAPIVVHLDLSKYGPALSQDTHYRNMFETSTSGGTCDVVRRRRWEDKLFDGAYSGSADAERVKYGVLNVSADWQGVRTCRQYGLSFIVLKGVRSRATFSAGDSAGLEAKDLATSEHYAHVLNQYGDEELCATLEVGTGRARGLDSFVYREYKEAQIHGDVRLSENIEAIYAHPLLQAIPETVETLRQLSDSTGAPLKWIKGGVDTPIRMVSRASSNLSDLPSRYQSFCDAGCGGAADDISTVASFRTSSPERMLSTGLCSEKFDEEEEEEYDDAPRRVRAY